MGKDAQERDPEHALIDQIQNFILELGQGFAFMGKQYPIHVGGDDFVVEYSLENIAGPLGIAEYQIIRCVPADLRGALPSIEELEGELAEYGPAHAKMGKTKAATG